METVAARLNAFVLQRFPGAALVERAGSEFLTFSIPSAGNRLSELFGVFEAQRAALQVADYSLGQMSLESVFNLMAVSGWGGTWLGGASARARSPTHVHPVHNLYTHTHAHTHTFTQHCAV